MSFGAEAWLWLLLLPPAALALLGWAVVWRSNARRRFGAREDGSPKWPAYVAPVLLVGAIAMAAFAAARPQIGDKDVRTEDKGIDVAVVVDVSQSMLSTDAEPSRLGRAQAEIGALLDRLQGDRVGLIIFAQQPFVRSPLTSDVTAVHRLVDGVDSERGLVPAGSDLGAAIRGGQRLLAESETRTKVMLIVSDGEDHGTTVAQSISAARRDGVRVYTAGAGTAEGAVVLDPDQLTGEPLPRVAQNGQPVRSHLQHMPPEVEHAAQVERRRPARFQEPRPELLAYVVAHQAIRRDAQ